MDNEKSSRFRVPVEDDQEQPRAVESSPRARNRTVMLTPEITGQVRARLAEELGDSAFEAVAPVPPVAPQRRGLGGASEPNSTDARPNTSGAQSQSFRAGQQQQSSAAYGRKRERDTKEDLKGFAADQSIEAEPHDLPAAVAGSSSYREVQEEVSHPAAGARNAAQTTPCDVTADGATVIVWHRESMLMGFLVSFDVKGTGESYELRTGRLIVSSQPAGSASCLFVADQSVSPMHAIVRVDPSGDIQVLDQLSEYGTRVRRAQDGRVEELCGDKTSVSHGDVLMFGERNFEVCLLSKREE